MENTQNPLSQSSFSTSLGAGASAVNTPFHIHNGQDSPRIPPDSIKGFIEKVRWTIPGVQAATDTNYGVIFIADRPCVVVGFQEVHQTKGTDGSAVTLQLEKLTGTTAPGSGLNLLQTAISLKANINTVQTGDISTGSDPVTGVRLATLAAPHSTGLVLGDRLALKKSGTLTSVANVTVTIFIQYP